MRRHDESSGLRASSGMKVQGKNGGKVDVMTCILWLKTHTRECCDECFDNTTFHRHLPSARSKKKRKREILLHRIVASKYF